uniref:Uncharacterized protein n=1 Tax=Nelumbo nucifera TaxID=4432 RepID=A0A822ZIQ8_NELNU|nr:TPA_asm: hypothetical protein HUJ06_004224 [Nelumbo nucifera]
METKIDSWRLKRPLEVYGQVWNEIREIGSSITSPWMVVGDFNEILYPEEKQGGR